MIGRRTSGEVAAFGAAREASDNFYKFSNVSAA
jgi:hypothetical protein